MSRLLEVWGLARARSILASLVLATATIVILFATRAAEQTNDSMEYAYRARTGHGMFHPHHVLFAPAVRFVWRAVRPLCASCDTILAAQLHNVAWAAVAVVSFCWVARQLTGSLAAGMLGGGLLLTAQGFWQYSTQAEVYVPAMGCLLLLLALVSGHRAEGFRVVETLTMSILLAVAVLYHQTGVLFSVPLVCFVWFALGRWGGRPIVIAMAVAGGLVLIGYAVAFLLSGYDRTVGGFIRFPFVYAVYARPGQGSFGNVSVHGLRALASAQLRNMVALPWRFPHVLKVAAACLLGASAWNLAQIARGAPCKALRMLLLVWLLTHSLFSLWWMPSEREFLLVTLAPILLLVVVTVGDAARVLPNPVYARRGMVGLLAGLSGITFSLNYRGIMEVHRSERIPYQRASKLAAIAPAECTICTGYAVRQNLRYYFDRSGVVVAPEALLHYYQGVALPLDYDLSEHPCILVEPEYLDPAFTIDGVNGYDYPHQWLRFLDWLFRFVRDQDRNVVACREFEVAGVGRGNTYVFLSQSRMRVDGVPELLEMLDHRISRASSVEVTSFGRWLAVAKDEG